MGQPASSPSGAGNKSHAALDWSVVVIARNEEAVIGACLESVVQAFVGRSYELIFVDSASTDRTIQIAQRYPARIVRLKETDPLRPSVGRHVGLHLARAEWVLFLDGDSILNATWIDPAAEALESDPLLAAVAGDMEHTLEAGQDQTSVQQHRYPDSDYNEARHLTGSALYRREALLRVGGYNPFLYAYEEAELGARLRKGGYRLRRLRLPMTRHFPKYRSETVRELFRRMGRGFFFGMGQFVRHVYAFRLPVQQPLAAVQRHLQFFVLLLVGLVATAVGFASGKWQLLSGWTLAMAAVFVLFAVRARSVRKPAYYFIEWTLGSLYVVRGMLTHPCPPEEFPNILGQDTIKSKAECEQDSSN